MKVSKIIVFVVFVALLFTSCIHQPQLMDGITSSKSAWFLCCTGLLLVFSAVSFAKDFSFRFNKLDLIVWAYLLFTAFNCWSHHSQLLSRRNHEVFGLVLLYLLLKKLFEQRNRRGFYYELVFLALTFVQIAIAILQWYDLVPSFNRYFKITGVFFNPGPFAIYLVGLSVFCLTLFFYSESKPIRIAAITLFIIGLTIIVVLLSRAAWAGAIVAIVFILEIKYRVFTQLAQRRTALIILVITMTVVITLVSHQLFVLKKDSANGRVLIWKLTSTIIRDFPLTGVGSENFPASLFKYQSHYFQLHPDRVSTEGQLAGETWYAFNDVLQITAEGGVIGLVLIVTLLTTIVRVSFVLLKMLGSPELSDRNALIVGSIALLLSTVVSSMFSYPLTLLPFKILFYSQVAFLSSCYDMARSTESRTAHIQGKMKWMLIVISISAGFYFMYYGASIYRGYLSWGAVTIGFQKNEITALSKKYPFLNQDPQFNIDLANELISGAKYDSAIAVLESAKLFIPNKGLYYTLGAAYKLSNRNEKAEEQYKFLEFALPNHLRPKFALAKLYFETNQSAKLRQKANEVLMFKPKIESIATKTMIREIQELLKKAPQLSASTE